MVIALLTALAAQAAWRDQCRVLVDKGDAAAAADCYGDAAADSDDDAEAAFAIALADVVSHARLNGAVVDADAEDAGNGGPFDLGDFALRGKAEVAALAFVDGSIVGGGVAGVASNLGVSSTSLGLLPLVGGVVAGGGAAGAMILLRPDQLSPGDVHVVRFGLLLAPYEGLTAAGLVGSVGGDTSVVAAAGVGATIVTAAAAAGIAAAFDVDPATPSLATSFGWIGGATGLLLWAAADTGAGSSAGQQALAVASLGVHAGIVGAFAAGPALHLTRPATLLVDAGGVAGFLVGGALAFGLNAPNPQLGYGGIAVSGLVGAGAGVIGAAVVSSSDDAATE